MDAFEIEPGYSTKEIPGRCVKCLAEKELNTCLMQLLRGDDECEEAQQRFEALVSFLQSPDSKQLIDESEKYLAEGKQVSVSFYFDEGKPKFKMNVTE